MSRQASIGEALAGADKLGGYRLLEALERGAVGVTENACVLRVNAAVLENASPNGQIDFQCVRLSSPIERLADTT